MKTYFTMTMSVRVQKMMETAPNTCVGLGSCEKTFGKVYSGDVPAQLYTQGKPMLAAI